MRRATSSRRRTKGFCGSAPTGGRSTCWPPAFAIPMAWPSCLTARSPCRSPRANGPPRRRSARSDRNPDSRLRAHCQTSAARLRPYRWSPFPVGSIIRAAARPTSRAIAGGRLAANFCIFLSGHARTFSCSATRSMASRRERSCRCRATFDRASTAAGSAPPTVSST